MSRWISSCSATMSSSKSESKSSSESKSGSGVLCCNSVVSGRVPISGRDFVFGFVISVSEIWLGEIFRGGHF